MHENWHGIAPVRLTPEPLGTEGELSPGPDNLNPAIPEDRDELVQRGYLTTERDEIGTVDVPEETKEPYFDPFGTPFDNPPELATPRFPTF